MTEEQILLLEASSKYDAEMQVREMDAEEILTRCSYRVADLGWDYDRMSSSGRKTYDELCNLLGIE
jgi:hypothetical protein